MQTFTRVFIPLNIRNKNGRIYTKEALEIPVQDFLNRKNDMGVIYGELGHPETFNTSFSRVSHTINNIWFENDKLMGEITLLNTNSGKLAQKFNNFVVRPRSAGTIDTNGYVKIKKIFTFDLISFQDDAFYSNQELRKIKLKNLKRIFDKNKIYE